MRAKQVWVTAIVALSAWPAAGLTAPLTLNEALGIAYETNPQLEAARAGVRATDENVAEADAGFRPKINADGTYGYEKSPSYIGIPSIAHPLGGEITLSQSVFDMSSFAEFDKAKAEVRADRAGLIGTEETVLFQAAMAYMDVVRDGSMLTLRQNNVTVLEKQRDATSEQFRLGELTKTDLAQSEARLAGARADLIAAQGQLAISRSNFEHFVGRPAETLESNPALPVLPRREEDVLAVATKSNPDLNRARENMRVADYAVASAGGAMMPRLSINGQYQYAHDNVTLGPGSQHVISLTGNVTVPIYQGGGDEAAVRKAKELRTQAELEEADIERQVIDNARSAWETYTSAAASIASNTAQVDADKIAYDGVTKEQLVGSRTIIEVLNAQQELLNSEVSLVIAKRNTTIAAYQLLAAIGMLTARNLALPVKLYNPIAHYDDDAGRWFGLGD